MEDKRAEIHRLQSELEVLDAQAGAAAAALNSAIDRLDVLRARVATANRQLRETLRDRARSRRMLAARLVALYKQGTPSLAEVLLTRPSLSNAQAAADALGQISRFDAALTATLERQRERRAALRAQLVRHRRQAAVQVRRATERRAQVVALVARSREVLRGAERELQQLIEAERRRLAAIKRAREAQARARARARAAARAAAARAASLAQERAQTTSPGVTPPLAPAVTSIPGGSHVYPIVGESSFSDDWLAGRAGGRLHVGIDLFAARGAPVVAVADGTLFRVGYSGISGNRLWLRDGAGTEFFYAHLDGYAPAAREGAYVTKGTVIGYNGDTGDARGTSPHVHFEIHPGGGNPIRPYPIVASWPRL